MTAAQLRAAILDLAIHGKLVPQNPNDEPASELLRQIEVIANASSSKRKRSVKSCGGSITTIGKENQPFALPNGWEWVSLGNITPSFTYGTAAKSLKTGKVAVLRMGNLQDGEIDFGDLVYTSDESDIQKYRLNKFDLLFNRTNSAEKVGKVSIYRGQQEAIYAGYLVCFRPLQMNPEFVNYVMNSAYAYDFCQSVKSDAIGQSNISASKLAKFPFPVPPLAEQKRIVAKIDELMPLVQRYEAAEKRRKTLDERMPDALKRSILKAAFDGELTEGVALEDESLDVVCEDIFTGNSLSDDEKRAFSKAEGLPFIGTKDVGFDQVVDYENGLHIPEAKSKYRTARAGSSLLCVEGGSSGRKLAILDRDVRFGNKLCAFTPGKKLDGKYLFFYLQSPQFQKQFTDLQNGPRKGAGITQIKALHIPFTDMDSQTRIVERIEAFLAELKRLRVGSC